MPERPIILTDGTTTTVLKPEPFAIEGKLQDLLERHPEVLWLGEVTQSAVKLVPIGREVTVPSGSIDLLLLGSDGLLTLVETKLSRNQEARRSVVAQLLEYASYIASWTVEKVEDTARHYYAGREQIDDFREWLGEALEASSEEDLIATLEAALSKGRLRLIIALDAIPDPLRSLATFVNQHSTFELLLLQVTSYPMGDERHVIVPDLFGYAPKSPSVSDRLTWELDRATMVEATRQRRPSAAEGAGRLYDLAQDGYEVRRGWGGRPGFQVGVTAPSGWILLYSVETSSCHVWFRPNDLLAKLADKRSAEDFANRLKQLFGGALSVGQKGVWYGASIEDTSARIDGLRPVLDRIAGLAKSPAQVPASAADRVASSEQTG